MKLMKKMICMKDAGGLNEVLMEGGLAIVGIVLLVVLVKGGKPVVEDFLKTCSEKAKSIFTMFG